MLGAMNIEEKAPNIIPLVIIIEKLSSIFPPKITKDNEANIVVNDVLKKLHWEVLKTIQELFMYPVTDFQCYQLISQYFEGQKITHVEAYDPSSHEPHLIYHKKVTGIADMFIKLKNYNHE